MSKLYPEIADSDPLTLQVAANIFVRQEPDEDDEEEEEEDNHKEPDDEEEENEDGYSE